MKLDKDTLKYINKVVGAAQLVGIDDIIIEPGMVRAMHEAGNIIMLQKTGVPDLPIGSIGLNRISTYQTRYDAAKSQDGFTVEAVADNSGDYVRSLTMKGKGVKIDYRCANPTTIKAPRQFKEVDHHEIELSGETVLMFQKALAAMGSEITTLICNDGVSFEFQDENADAFKIDFADDTTILEDGADAKFAHKYPAKVLQALFKHNPTGTFIVGKAGTLSVMVNDIRVTVFPRVE